MVVNLLLKNIGNLLDSLPERIMQIFSQNKEHVTAAKITQTFAFRPRTATRLIDNRVFFVQSDETILASGLVIASA